jgi:hypothetical protein
MIKESRRALIPVAVIERCWFLLHCIQGYHNSVFSREHLSSEPWPAQFEISIFSLDIELILQAANGAYRKDETLWVIPDQSMTPECSKTALSI